MAANKKMAPAISERLIKKSMLSKNKNGINMGMRRISIC
jgi:hypothetical protein